MIASINGILRTIETASLVIETASGLGYRVFYNQGQSLLHQIDQPISLFTYHHIREESDDLYGFITYVEWQVFMLLLHVSGVGPKLAMSIIDTLGPESTVEAIAANQPAIFRSISGVGQKLAEKIILELRTNVSSVSNLSGTSESSQELVEALLGLGYDQAHILAIVTKLDRSLPVAQQLKEALRQLGQLK